MKTKQLSLLFFVIISVKTFAQDLIITLKNEDIVAKISEVTTSEIKYKKWDNQDGPIFTITKATVCMIKYQNGSIDILNKGLVTMQKRIKAEQDKQQAEKESKQEALLKKTNDEIVAKAEADRKSREQARIDSTVTATAFAAREAQRIESEKKHEELEQQRADARQKKEAIQQLENSIRLNKSKLKDANAQLAVEIDKMGKIKEFMPFRLPSEREQQIRQQQKNIDALSEYVEKLKTQIYKDESNLGYTVD